MVMVSSSPLLSEEVNGFISVGFLPAPCFVIPGRAKLTVVAGRGEGADLG